MAGSGSAFSNITSFLRTQQPSSQPLDSSLFLSAPSSAPFLGQYSLTNLFFFFYGHMLKFIRMLVFVNRVLKV